MQANVNEKQGAEKAILFWKEAVVKDESSWMSLDELKASVGV